MDSSNFTKFSEFPLTFKLSLSNCSQNNLNEDLASNNAKVIKISEKMRDVLNQHQETADKLPPYNRELKQTNAAARKR